MSVHEILNLEFATQGRDAEIVRPVIFALRKMGYSVHQDCILNWRSAIVRSRPNLLLMSNGTGDHLSVKITRYAASIGLPCVTLTSEGDFQPYGIDDYLWGWNKERTLSEDMTIQWSERARDLSISIAPTIRDRILVGGATGFDRYKFYPFLSKQAFCTKYKKRFSRVIGFASWGFDVLFEGDHRLEGFIRFHGAQLIDRFKRDREDLNQILRQLIQSLPDTLFLLKLHPGVDKIHLSEFEGLNRFENVILIQHEENVADCINASDLWLAFDSTTCLEAWLLGRQTFLINPSGSDFKRARVSQGSPVYEDFERCIDAIRTFQSVGSVPGFEEKESVRDEIIRETIQWSDGKNHLRTAFLIDRFIKSKTKDTNLLAIGWQDCLLSIRQAILYAIARWFPKLPGVRYYARRTFFSQAAIETFDSTFYPALDEFYSRNSLLDSEIQELTKMNPPSQHSK